jgi:SAM-dependent methyltransferase
MSDTEQQTGTATSAAASVPQARQAVETIDEDRLNQLLGQVIGDLGGLVTAPLVQIGDRLGLFRALDGAGGLSSAELAERTDLNERYVREWLLVMGAAGYLSYEGDGRFRLSAEQAQLFVRPDSPAYVVGGFQNMTAAVRSLDRLTEAFRTGAGMGWHEHHRDMFEGTERFFRPGYLASLTTSWIPAFPGLEGMLRAGARVADVGCGFGASTRIMAEAYPASTFVGVDYHTESVAMARQRVSDAGLGDRVDFQVAGAAELTGQFGLITFFDCLHDMPDPGSALEAARRAVADDGYVMLVEPISGDRIEDTLNPVGRLFAGASVFICLPSGLSAEPRTGLGNQAGPSRTIELAHQAGFTRARVAATGPFNLVYELRP